MQMLKLWPLFLTSDCLNPTNNEKILYSLTLIGIFLLFHKIIWLYLIADNAYFICQIWVCLKRSYFAKIKSPMFFLQLRHFKISYFSFVDGFTWKCYFLLIHLFKIIYPLIIHLNYRLTSFNSLGPKIC